LVCSAPGEGHIHGRKLTRLPDLWATVLTHLHLGWSPEQIAGKLEDHASR
jgi:IS30 family transposase